MQSISIRRESLEQVANDLRDTQARLSEVLPKLIAAREQLQRSRVRAPASGQVVGLTVFTVGGVVAPGQTLMEVVPSNRDLIIQAQLQPADADDVYPGQNAQVRFLSVHDRTPAAADRHRCERCRPTASPTRKPDGLSSAPRSRFRRPSSIGCEA